MKTQLLALATAPFLIVSSSAQNLIVNGDFSGGNSGFSTDYSYVGSGASTTSGTYGIRTNSQNFNPGYNLFNDHTSGTGLMMLVDGHSASKTVWSETVAVSSNQVYQFSGWAIPAGGNPAQIQLLINGAQVTSFTLPSVIVPSTPAWINFSTNWFSTTNTTATLAIFDLNPNYLSAGDDFGLDDLSLTNMLVPDLSPVSVSWTGQPTAGQNLTLNMTVTNMGSGYASGGWYEAWVLSTNATTAGSVGSFESYYCCHNIPASGSFGTSPSFTLPSVPAGNYYLIGIADNRNYVYEANESNNTLAVPITVGVPDLSPVSVSWTGQPTAGQNLTLNISVTNSGSGYASGGWYEAWVLSTNATTAGSVGSFEAYYCCHNIPANGIFGNSVSFTLPNVPAGNYYLIGIADNRNYVYEANESNNTLAVPITVGVPDLSPVSVSWTGQPTAGQNLTLNMTVTNMGSGYASGGWYEAWVLSTNATTAGSVGSFESYYCCHNIPASGSFGTSPSFTLPSVPAGNYYLIGIADNRNYVYEANESNNTLAVPITVGVPDLSPVSVSWTGQPTAGQNLTLNISVTNSGSGYASGGWYEAWVLSTNATTAGSVGSFEAYYCCHNIPANGIFGNSVSFTLPNVPAGNYYLIGIADNRNYVYEANESNNTLAVPIAVGVPDLSPVSVSWTGQPTAGQNLTLNISVTNSGSGYASGGWYEAWVLSTNATTAGSVGSFEAYYCCHNIPANGIFGNSVSFTLPSVPAGNYYLIGIADNRNYVYEANETNNTLAVAMTIGTTDLAATNLSTSGPTVAGTNLLVSFTVINTSTNTYSSFWYDGVTLSTNNSLSGAIASWDWYGYHSIAAGGSYVQSQFVSLPGVAAGTNYYIIVQADDRNYVPETTKTNNFQVLQVTITNRPPSITFVAPTNGGEVTSCIPVSFNLSAGIQSGSYAVTNVSFYDGSTLLGHSTTSPYKSKSPPLEHGVHSITAQAVDIFGLMATSQVATVSVEWPAQLNVLHADLLGTNCVVCMAALNGSSYVIQTATNLQSPINWQPFITNQVLGSVLVVTNQRNASMKFYRAQQLP